MKRIWLPAAIMAIMLGGTISGAAASSIPSGERVVGQSVLEPVYNDEMAGQIGFVSTPTHVSVPVNANPRALDPFYVPVYPVGSQVGPLLCEHTPVDNCPDHGPEIAALAAQMESAVYGAGVLGHDHLMDFPGGSDFNPNWEPIVILFTSKSAADHTHLLTDAQISAAVASGTAIEVPLPQLAFLCAKVSGAVYARGVPLG